VSGYDGRCVGQRNARHMSWLAKVTHIPRRNSPPTPLPLPQEFPRMRRVYWINTSHGVDG